MKERVSKLLTLLGIAAAHCLMLPTAHAAPGAITGSDALANSFGRKFGNSVASVEVKMFNNSWYVHDGSISGLSAVGADGGTAPEVKLLGSTWRFWDLYGAGIAARNNGGTNLNVSSRIAFFGNVQPGACSRVQNTSQLSCHTTFGTSATKAAVNIPFTIGIIPVTVGGSIFANVSVSALGRGAINPLGAPNHAAATDSADGGFNALGNLTGTAFFAIGVHPIASVRVEGRLNILQGKYVAGGASVRTRCTDFVNGCASNNRRVNYRIHNQALSDTGISTASGRLDVIATLVTAEVIRQKLASWDGVRLSLPTIYDQSRGDVFSGVL